MPNDPHWSEARRWRYFRDNLVSLGLHANVAGFYAWMYLPASTADIDAETVAEAARSGRKMAATITSYEATDWPPTY